MLLCCAQSGAGEWQGDCLLSGSLLQPTVHNDMTPDLSNHRYGLRCHSLHDALTLDACREPQKHQVGRLAAGNGPAGDGVCCRGDPAVPSPHHGQSAPRLHRRQYHTRQRKLPLWGRYLRGMGGSPAASSAADSDPSKSHHDGVFAALVVPVARFLPCIRHSDEASRRLLKQAASSIPTGKAAVSSGDLLCVSHARRRSAAAAAAARSA